jgi:hypothetical protein
MSVLAVERHVTLNISTDRVQGSHIAKLVDKVLVHTRSLLWIRPTNVVDDSEIQRGVHSEWAIIVMAET